MRTIDIHCHVMSQRAHELSRPHYSRERDPFFRYVGPSTVVANQRLMDRIRPKLTTVDERLRDMDAMRIDVQVVSIAPPQFGYWAERNLGIQLARAANEHLSEVVTAHPDRFVALGTIPLQATDAALDELDHIVQDLGFPGIEICTNVNGADLDDVRFEPVFASLEELGAFVLLHPHGFWDGARLDAYYLINTVGMPMDSTVAIARLILGGVLERHPALTMCVAHGGGYLPSSPGRLDHAYRVREDARERIREPPSAYLRRLHFDTMVYDPGDLGRLIARYGADHVLLGSDYPYDMGEPDPVRLVESIDGLSASDRALVLGGNAARLLGIER